MAGVLASSARYVLPAAGNTIRKIYSQVMSSRGGQALGRYGGPVALIAGTLTLDEIIDSVKEDAPESDEQALRETAHTVARMLGLDGSEVLWPVHMRGEEKGSPIDPVYFTMNLATGRAWYSSNYHSRKSVNAGFRRGQRSGRFRARRDVAQTKEIVS